MTVTLWSQFASGIVLLVLLAAIGGPPPAEAVLWGVPAGVCGGLALLMFYRALAIGAMSVVAPIAASVGTLVPIVVALVRGEVPSGIALFGVAITLIGVTLVSLPSGKLPHPTGTHRAVIGMALLAAVGFGLFFVFIDAGASTAGDSSPLWVAGGSRAASVVTLTALTLLTGTRSAFRWPGWRGVAALGAIGLLDTTANVLFALGSTVGNLAVVAVLASLYPAGTVLLARLVLKERMDPRNGAGSRCRPRCRSAHASVRRSANESHRHALKNLCERWYNVS